MRVEWKLTDFAKKHNLSLFDSIGYIEDALNVQNPHGAREQLHDSYAHGGGWSKFDGFKLLPDDSIAYPGDPPQHPLATAELRDERILVYPSAWVAIVQKDGSYEIARMD